jgi:hypothetical protein
VSQHREPSDDSLDELLRRAEWPAIDYAGERRLRETWRRSFDRPRRVFWRVGLAAAAALACAAVAGWWTMHRTAPKSLVIDTRAREVHPVVSLNDLPRGETRQPTPFERLIVTVPRASHAIATTQPARAPEQTVKPPALVLRDPREVNEFLARVVAAATRDQALRELREASDPPVNALLAQLNNPHVERRFAAARALGEVCRPDVVEVLWRMVRRDVYRREALAALTQCHDPLAGRYLAMAGDDPALESQLRSVRDQMKRYF